jgi:BTB/POZ domain
MTSTMTMEADLAPLCPNRSIDCWFPDGNVVLQVESTLFRVHRSILSMHSEVFHGMF